jgi:aminoglycoside phosphotransferase (APT) family kinase protein
VTLAQLLGSPVEAWTFTSSRRALTRGARLADGRRVVVKTHPAGVPLARLRAVHRVQRALAAGGFPCPAPVAPPMQTADGVVTAEEELVPGRRARPREDDLEVMAATLAEITARCLPFRSARELDAALVSTPHDGAWPEPHDARLSLAESVPWIDALGLRARERRRRGRGPLVVGHGDWHAEHLRVAGGSAVAVYDWDSLVRAPEPFLVGCAVAGFTADWSVDEPPAVPSLAEAEAFTRAYEAARGAAFTAFERTTIHSHWVELTAYAARLELARAAAGLPVSGRYERELAEHGERLLVAGSRPRGRRSRC